MIRGVVDPSVESSRENTDVASANQRDAVATNARRVVRVNEITDCLRRSRACGTSRRVIAREEKK